MQKVVQKPTNSAEIWKSFSQPSTSTSPLFKNTLYSSSDDEESIPTSPLAQNNSDSSLDDEEWKKLPKFTRTINQQVQTTTTKQPHTCKIEDPTGINRSVRSEFTPSNQPPISPRYENESKPTNILVPIIDSPLSTSIEQQTYEKNHTNNTLRNE